MIYVRNLLACLKFYFLSLVPLAATFHSLVRAVTWQKDAWARLKLACIADSLNRRYIGDLITRPAAAQARLKHEMEKLMKCHCG